MTNFITLCAFSSIIYHWSLSQHKKQKVRLKSQIRLKVWAGLFLKQISFFFVLKFCSQRIYIAMKIKFFGYVLIFLWLHDNKMFFFLAIWELKFSQLNFQINFLRKNHRFVCLRRREEIFVKTKSFLSFRNSLNKAIDFPILLTQPSHFWIFLCVFEVFYPLELSSYLF